MTKILLVDDEAILADSIIDVLELEGYQTHNIIREEKLRRTRS